MNFSLFSCLVAFAAVSLAYARGEGEECSWSRPCDEGLVCCKKVEFPRRPSGGNGVTTTTAAPAEGARFLRIQKARCVAEGALGANCTKCLIVRRPSNRRTTTAQPAAEESYADSESARFGIFGAILDRILERLPSTCADNLTCNIKTNVCEDGSTTTSSTTTTSTASYTTAVATDAAE